MSTLPTPAERTIQFYGVAYGASPVTLTAVVNGNTVFSGEVLTADQPINPEPIVPGDQQYVLFSIANCAPTNFSGSVPMTLTVTNGDGVLLGNIWSNYQTGNTVGYSAEPGVFGPLYFGEPTNSEGTPDPRSSVKINGTTQVPPLPPSEGTWNWFVYSGSNISHNLNISVGAPSIWNPNP
jgi:hypothetical protein